MFDNFLSIFITVYTKWLNKFETDEIVKTGFKTICATKLRSDLFFINNDLSFLEISTN